MPLPDLTTISEFRHPQLTSRVTIVGNHHVGTETYMDSLRDELEKYEASGSTIHYEETRNAEAEELAQESACVQAIYRRLLYIKQVFKDDIITISPDSIDSVIEPKKSVWENHDATTLQLAEFISKRPVQYFSLFTFSEMLATLTDSPKTFREKVYNKAGYVAVVLAFDVGLNSSLVTYRNSVALQAVDSSLQEIPDRDITLLWGQGHVAGLTRGMYQRGFQRTHISAYSSEERPS